MRRKIMILVAAAAVLTMVMGLEVLGSNLYSDKPLVDLGQLIDMGPGFKPHATSSENTNTDADVTDPKQDAKKDEAEDSKEIVISVSEKKIRINGRTILHSTLEDKFMAEYKPGKTVTVVDDYGEYKTCIKVEQFLKDKGIEYTVRTEGKS